VTYPRVIFSTKKKRYCGNGSQVTFKDPLVRGGMAPGQARANKLYTFKDKHVVSLFKLLQKSNKLKLSEIKRPKEVGKTDNPSYCLYHRMLGHRTKNCYIFKDVLQVLIDVEVLKFRLKKKKVTANMTASHPFNLDGTSC